MTYRDRRLAKADRLRGWAGKRETDATAVLQRNRTYTDDIAFNTQPGHIPLRARVIAQNDRACGSLDKAQEMKRRADGIESAADGAIYRDDPDEVERLEEKLAGLEAQRERVKKYNASCRKGSPDLSVLDEKQRADILSLARIGSVHVGKGGAFPTYHLSNLGGSITGVRKRLAEARLRRARLESADEVSAVGDGVKVRPSVVRLGSGWVDVVFDEKPVQEVRDALRGAGFRWDRTHQCWYGAAASVPAEITEAANERGEA